MQLGTDSYYMTKVPQAFLYEKDGTVADEVLSGWILQRLPEKAERGSASDARIPVQTHYGYRGYIDPSALRPIALDDIRRRAAGEKTMVVTKRFADLLSQPRVQGQILTTLSIGSFQAFPGGRTATVTFCAAVTRHGSIRRRLPPIRRRPDIGLSAARKATSVSSTAGEAIPVPEPTAPA